MSFADFKGSLKKAIDKGKKTAHNTFKLPEEEKEKETKKIDHKNDLKTDHVVLSATAGKNKPVTLLATEDLQAAIEVGFYPDLRNCL
jgi:hypothetical protein